MPLDSYRFLDFASRQIMKAWAARQEARTARARNASKGHPPPPIVDLLRRKPWLLADLYRGRIPEGSTS